MLNTRRALVTAASLVLLCAVAIVSASYAWLGVSRIPFVSDVSVSVITENALLIAPDDDGQPGEWGDYLDASAFLSDIVPLRPVTWTSSGLQRVQYDVTGRTAGVTPIGPENINVKYPNADKNSPESQAAEELGYVARLDFWLKTEGTPADVSLIASEQTADGQLTSGTYAIGRPSWNTETFRHDNAGYGTETTLRLGFQCEETDTSGAATGLSHFVLYEPNANVHVSLEDGYVETLSVDGGPLQGEGGTLILQNASTWHEQDPILMDSVIYEPGEFTSDDWLLSLGRATMQKVTLYIWMEGQDADCIARNVARGASIDINIKFGVHGWEHDTGIGRDETLSR